MNRRGQQRPATIINGRVVRDSRSYHAATTASRSSTNGSFHQQRPCSFVSWARVAVVGSICVALIISNPANVTLLDSLFLSTTGRNNKSPLSLERLSKMLRRTTNYLFFSLEHDMVSSKVSIHALGSSVDCFYENNYNNNRNYNDFVAPICKIMSQQLCHGQPLLYHDSRQQQQGNGHLYKRDRAFTAHRALVWTYVVGYLFSFCVPNYRYYYYYGGTAASSARYSYSSYIWNSLKISLCQILLPHPDAPLWSTLLQGIMDSSAWLYPALQRMDTLIQVQHPQTSYFRPTDNDTLNFTISVLCLGSIAVIINAISRALGSTKSNFDGLGKLAVGAVALGYFRGSHDIPTEYDLQQQQLAIFPWLSGLAGASVGSFSTTTTSTWNHSNPMTVTWLRLLSLATVTHSLETAIWWALANMAAGVLGEYQLQNQFLVVFAHNFFQTVDTTLRTVMGGFNRWMQQLNDNYDYVVYQQHRRH